MDSVSRGVVGVSTMAKTIVDAHHSLAWTTKESFHSRIRATIPFGNEKERAPMPPTPLPPMVFSLAPDPLVPTTVVNRSLLHIAEGVVFLDFGLVEPIDIVAWHQAASTGQPPHPLRARHNARIVTNIAALMNLRQQLNELAKQMGIDQELPPTPPPVSTKPN